MAHRSCVLARFFGRCAWPRRYKRVKVALKEVGRRLSDRTLVGKMRFSFKKALWAALLGKGLGCAPGPCTGECGVQYELLVDYVLYIWSTVLCKYCKDSCKSFLVFCLSATKLFQVNLDE